MKSTKLIKSFLATASMTLALVLMPAAVAEAAPSTYTVERGDNLSKIARKVYGNEKLWRAIYNANSGAVKKNYIIYAGQTLVIPAVDGSQNPLPSQNAAATPAPAPTTSAPAPATPAPAPTTPTPAPTTPAPTPTTPAPTTPAGPGTQTTAQEYTLDYNSIAPWVDGGFIGNDGSGSPVVMAIDAKNEYAIIIFGDNSDMTAASFVGPITYSGDYATITDEANGMSLTFLVSTVNDSTLALDMGEIGKATITAATKEDVLNTIKTAIENYKHVA